MTRDAIFEAITAERARQDEKHPVTPTYLLHPFGLKQRDIKNMALDLQEANDKLEAINQHDWHGLVREEMYEFFAETDKARQVEEAIQNAALWVRIIEEITK